MSDSLQILILLILINVALCSYYYLLYQDSYMKKEEDIMIARLEEKFTNPNAPIIESLEAAGTPSVIHGFHDKFSINNNNNNKMLGWRHFYLKNQSNQEIENDGNFDGVITRRYLDNLENVQNYITPIQNRIR
jgi:hypothetical protein